MGLTTPKLVVVGVAAAVLFGPHPGASAHTNGHSCATGYVPAHINGHFHCLHEGQSCNRKLDRAYHRYLFHCHGRYLTFGWNFLRRPFHVAELAPGSPCPTSQQTGTLDQFGIPGIGGPAWGPGPAYPTALEAQPQPVLNYFFPMDPAVYGTVWGGDKALWVIAPGYHGQILIRGVQLDGPNGVRFQNGVPGFTDAERMHPVTELRILGYGGTWPAVTRVRAPGCYTYQVDGLHFSYDIVFQAKSLGPEPSS
jgi:hypothetical protein